MGDRGAVCAVAFLTIRAVPVLGRTKTVPG